MKRHDVRGLRSECAEHRERGDERVIGLNVDDIPPSAGNTPQNFRSKVEIAVGRPRSNAMHVQAM